MTELNSFIIENIVKNITKYIIILLFIIYVIIELITISTFTFSYNYNYNYGKKLKSVCNNKNLEFETERYQVYNNILNNILENNRNKSYNYVIILSIILIFSIIFGLVITYILYYFINDIINSDVNNSKILKMLCKMMMFIICGFSLIIFPLYIGYNLDKNNEYKLNDFNTYITYAEIIFNSLLAILIIINMNTYNDTYNYKYGNNFIIIISILFYFCFNLTKNIISYYKKKKNIIEFKNENIKSYNDFANNFLKTELNTNVNILNDYILNLFNIDLKNIELNYFTSILIIALILIGMLFLFNRSKTFNKYIKGEINYKEFIECLLYYGNNKCENFILDTIESRIIYNFVILPIIFTLLIIITINSTINYNEVINKNIILHPLLIYKTELDNVNTSFTTILDNDKFAYKEKKSVDRNIANTILLVFYNEIFSDMLSLTSIDKDKYKEFANINISPKFKYVFNNKKEILDYTKLHEYNIENYLKNECGDDIFINKNLNSKCNETNRFILYYMIRSVFLYKPIADIDGKKDKNKYEFYKNILKYKIYKSIIYYKNEKNYLGNAKLNDNNYDKNCTLNIKYEHPKITKEELLILLGKLVEKLELEGINYNLKKIFTDNININDTKEKIYTQIQELIDRPELDLIQYKNRIIDPIIDNNINSSDEHQILLVDRINKLELNNNIIKNHRIIITKIVNQFIEYIIDVQVAYFHIYKDGKNIIEIQDSDLDEKFRKEGQNPEDNQKIKDFIKKYKKTIKENFDLINVELSNYEIGENEYHKQNNVTNYLLNNYYIANNYNVKTYIEKITKDNYTNTQNDDSSVEDDTIEKVKIFMSNIIILFYYNHYFILEIKNKYSNLYLNTLVNSVQSIYGNSNENKKYKELKKEYIIKINELIIILKYTIYNIISDGNKEKITEYIKKSDVNNYIIDELIIFDDNYKNQKIMLNDNIDSIKEFIINTQNLSEGGSYWREEAQEDNEYHLITNDYVNNIKGLINRIDHFINYIKISYIEVSNEKNIEFINNILIEQKNILEVISNTDINKLNFNNILDEYKYIDKFNDNIKEYKNYYRKFHGIEEREIIETESNKYTSTYSNNSNKKNSNIIYQNADISSNMILILITIYIIILYILIKIR